MKYKNPIKWYQIAKPGWYAIWKGKAKASIGLLLVGFAFAIVAHADGWYRENKPFGDWFILGVAGFVIGNSGASITISGTNEYDKAKEQRIKQFYENN